VFGVAAILGPLLGGFLTENFSWHLIFFINIPIGIVALAVIGRLLPTVKRPDASHNFDYLGGAVFTVAVAAFLVGLTNKQTSDWGTFDVGGLILIGLALWGVFILIESRAKEPIVPLGLWRDRTYASSIIATFLVSIGFFGAAVFLPQWFQFVEGASPTNSGLYTLALLAGVIIGSVGSGIIVSRTGKYKPVIAVGLAVMAVGLLLMSQIRADTELPVLWSWMFVTGLGIGPTLAVFTIVVQNAVPIRSLGVATSNLTFFRQVGGSVGLAALGTIFATRLADEIPVQVAAAGVPQQLVDQFVGQDGGNAANFFEVGKDLGATLLAAVPPQLQETVKPIIPKIVFGIQQAFSLAVSQVFLVGVGTTLAALVVVVLFMKQIPLRKTVAGRENLLAEAIEESQAAGAGVPSDPGVMPEPALD
jgi:MFS family permease